MSGDWMKCWRTRHQFAAGMLVWSVCTILLHPLIVMAADSAPVEIANESLSVNDEQERFLEDLSRRTFRYFLETADPTHELVPNRYPSEPLGTSIGGQGFALTAWGMGVERGYITRERARELTLKNLRGLYLAPQGEAAQGTSGQRGFYYHFLNLKTVQRAATSELSTIDSALFLMGVLFAQSYFDRDHPEEAQIRTLAEKIYRRVQWDWTARDTTGAVRMSYRPERGWSLHDWEGYNEGMMIYVLGLGSPTYPLHERSWTGGWSAKLPERWGRFYDQEHLIFGPLFGHQYSHVWIDFRGIQDAFMRSKGIDYFENSRRATLAQRAYAQLNPNGWTGYGGNIWGWTASDGPLVLTREVDGVERAFRGYMARGIDPALLIDDGTIAPTAAGGSIPFAPEIAIPALMEMKQRFGQYIYNDYGFVDAFNLTFTIEDAELQRGKVHQGFGWSDSDHLVIDQGVMLLMIENHRSGLIWKVMRGNPHIVRGLQRMGFSGGWLESAGKSAHGRDIDRG